LPRAAEDRASDEQEPDRPLHRRIPLGQGAMKRTLYFACFALTVSGCSASTPKGATFVQAHAIEDPPPPKPVIVTAPPPVPGMPGPTNPMRPESKSGAKGAHAPPQQVVADANKRAAQAPDASGTFNAIVQYSYEPGTLYQVFAAPMRITDLALAPGEH